MAMIDLRSRTALVAVTAIISAATTYAAIKIEYRTWTRGPGTVRNNGGFAQVCFTF